MRRRELSQFFRLPIAKKLFLGFLSIGILIILVAFITLSSLQRLNEINRGVIERDVRLIEITDKMIEALLAQELYGRRSFILKSSEMEALFCWFSVLREVGKLQTSMERMQKANKNLRDEVAGLKETIERLKSLDRQIERRRSLSK